jgi:pimeloyl-ACP methyl ester carboxylesterase
MNATTDQADRPAASWGGVSHTVDIGGPVHYVDFGGAAHTPRLVFVHGLGGSHLNWAPMAPMMTPYVRPLALDLAGFGYTAAAGRRTSVQANAQLLRRFLRKVVREPVILVGNSMGGMISVLAATADPTLVKRLVLVDPTLPGGVGGQVDPVVRATFFIGMLPGIGEFALSRQLARVPVRQRIERVLSLCCADPSQVSPQMLNAAVTLEESRLGERGRVGAHLEATRSLLRVLARPRAYFRRLSAVRTPVLLLHGVQDRLVPVAAARAAAKRLPHWRYVELDAGHVPQLEQPQRVADEIINWLADTGSLARDMNPDRGAVRAGMDANQVAQVVDQEESSSAG